MIDIIKPLHSNEEKMHIDAIHGHTIIELKDVRTGFRDRIESDNVVTDGAESLLRTMGHQLNMRCTNNDNFPYWWQLFFGGLMLCDDIISTSAKYKPAGVNPVAYGAYKGSNSGVCTELGTYNNAESAYDGTRFKQVYDYYTNQANGTIKSACLLNALVLRSGYGCPTSGKFLSPIPTLPEIIKSNQIRNLDSVMQRNQYNKYSYIVGDKCYEPQSEPLTSGASQLKIKEYSFNPNTYRKLNWTPDVCINTPIREITFNFTAVNRNYWVIPVQFSNKFIGIPNATSNAPLYANTSYPLLVFDLDNETVSTLTITPTVNIVGYYDPTVKEINSAITFFGIGSDDYVYIINATSNTFVKTDIKMSISDSYTYNLYGVYCISDELYQTYYQSGNAYRTYVYDPILNQSFAANGTGLYDPNTPSSYNSGFFSAVRYLYDKDIYLCRCDNSASTTSMRMIHNPFRLMTINNLPEAVEKTANKTMKVTYELTME